LQLFDQTLDQLTTLNNQEPVYNALQEFIHHCIGRFIKTWQRRPLLAIEVKKHRQINKHSNLVDTKILNGYI
jgi:hypothetical protein